LNTDRGMISSQAPFGMKKGSMAETSFGNINRPPNDMEESNMDLSLISQKQHKFPSPGRSSNNQQYREESAVGSMMIGNNKTDHFTS
jgi:hypothetical protein